MVADVLDGEVGVEVALGLADEDAGDAAAADGVHLAGDAAVLVGQPGHERATPGRAELVAEPAP